MNAPSEGSLEVSNVRLPLDAGLPTDAGRLATRRAVAAALGVGEEDVADVLLLRRSVDARKKADVHFVASVRVDLAPGTPIRPAPGVQARPCEEAPSLLPAASTARAHGGARPVVVGAGPAGLFCAWYLAKAGMRPVVVERGADVDARTAAVHSFEAGGPFDPRSNIQFGEGGAGTFSDGKLTTNIKSPYARDVLRLFVGAGAPDEILWQAKPHIGTDLLRGVVKRLRCQIEEMGGQVRFFTQLVGLDFEGGVVSGVRLAPSGSTEARGETSRLEVDAVVLACGHSARDTFRLLYDAGVAMEQKSFSVGVRIEHPQSLVDRAQYGPFAGHEALGPADYKLSVQLPATASDGPRGVYTFCMCPGGEVVCAASEPESVVVNGMSRHARDGENANSALLVGVGPQDFGSDHVLAGVEFQRRIERAAYGCALAAGGAPYSAPAQTVGSLLSAGAADFGAGRVVEPSYVRGVAWCDLRRCLPGFVVDALASALPLLDRRLHGFADPGAVMIGVETRSSSPVRILRGGDLQAFCDGRAPSREGEGASGLFPCGEGAGYAGGIMSAACDGLRVAAAIAGGALAPHRLY